MTIHTAHSDPILVSYLENIFSEDEDGFINIGAFLTEGNKYDSSTSLTGRISSTGTDSTIPPTSLNSLEESLNSSYLLYEPITRNQLNKERNSSNNTPPIIFSEYSSAHSSTESLSSENTESVEKILEKAFDEACWLGYFGDVGTVPPIPSDLLEILQGPCPFFQDKTVEETHKLILIPKTVNNLSLTLNNIEKLFDKSTYKDSPHMKINLDPEIKRIYGEISIQKSYWLLITLENIPKSLNLSHKDQKTLVNQLGCYTMPSLLEMAILSLVESIHLIENQDKTQTEVFTRCQEFNRSKSKTESIIAKHFPLTHPEITFGSPAPLSYCGTIAVRPFCFLENREIKDFL